jgi:hypothetical protein
VAVLPCRAASEMWPNPVAFGTDEKSLVRGEWHEVFGRWHRTVRCFVDVVPLASDGPTRDRLHNFLAYQVMLGAAQHCHEYGGEWERCLVGALNTRMKLIIDTFMQKNFSEDTPALQAFLKLGEDDRLLIVYYDHNRHARIDRNLGPEDGVFCNEDLARFFSFETEEALRQAASRARRRFEDLIKRHESANGHVQS